MSNYSKHQLTKQDADELCKAVSLFQSDETTKQLAQQYILQYRHTGSTNEKSSVVVKCALFFAEKSQYLYDMKGERIQGIGLSLNQIIKTYPNIDQFVLILKDFIRKVRLPDLEVENDLHNVIERINFSQTFYNKFEKILKDLNFIDKVEPGYYRIFSNFIWLLFIDSKAEISRQSRDIVKNTCILATVFYSMIRYCLDYIKPMFLADFNEKMNGNKQTVAKVIGRITEKIFNLFLIQDFETYKLSVSDFDDYFETLLQTNILKNNSEKIDFFNPDIINLNYKRLDAMYQKRLGPNDLDQRFFLKNRITTLTPSKITPFEKQGAHNYAKGLRIKKQKIQNMNPNTMTTKNFYSHRVLDYECEKELIESNNNLRNNAQVKQLKFPKNVLFSPSISKTSLICATPVTLGMQMYNYIIEKPRIVRQSLSVKQYESFVNPWVSQFSPLKRNTNDSIQERKTKQMRLNIITSLYIIVVQAYFNEYQELQNRQQICKSFLALSAQTVCFVCNIPQSNFDLITEQMNLNPLDLYKATQYFYRFDKLMPSQLRSHFIDIQTKLINSQLWKRQESIQFLSFICHSSSNKIEDKLLKSIFQYIIQQLTKLVSSFKLSEPIQEQILTIMKCLLCFQTQLLYHRFLDQLVICCFYAVCKNHKIQIKFNDIKTKYEESNSNTKQEHKQMMCNVYIDDSTKADIIKFYNGVFIASSKPYLKDLQQQFFNDTNCLLKLKMKQIPMKDVYHSLKRHRMKNIFQSQTSSKYMNAKKILDYGNERNNYHQLNIISQGQDQKSVQRDCQLLRAGKSNPSTRISTAKTQAYCN